MCPSVVVVEDEALISMLVADALVESGFEVHEMATADEALAYIEAGNPVDVLFTDINLPGRIDGAQLAQRVRERRPELPIVYASGRFAAGDFTPMVPRSLFVAKPYRPEEVCALMARLTEGVRH